MITTVFKYIIPVRKNKLSLSSQSDNILFNFFVTPGKNGYSPICKPLIKPAFDNIVFILAETNKILPLEIKLLNPVTKQPDRRIIRMQYHQLIFINIIPKRNIMIPYTVVQQRAILPPCLGIQSMVHHSWI